MEQVCHRCGENLVADELYCPHCGAPQLRVEESGAVVSAQEGSLQQSLDRATDMMRWRAAIRAALLIAAPTALLSALLSLGALWVFIGGFFTVRIYRRRTDAPTDSRIGWRIGGLMGVLSAILWLAIEALSMLVERYGMHQGQALDSTFRKAIQAAIHTMNQENPAFQHQFPWFAHFWLSPDGIATLYLSGTALIALSMILFSALGGALGGSSQRNRTQQNGTL
jgi:hypothetical protein